jgi:hypothetical protein
VFVCSGFQVLLQVFQSHILSVSSFFFLYVASDKIRSAIDMGCVWEGEGAQAVPHRSA